MLGKTTKRMDAKKPQAIGDKFMTKNIYAVNYGPDLSQIEGWHTEGMQMRRLIIENDPVRGFDWQLIQKEGIGTYAIIAGTDESPDDQYIVIEEYDDPSHRNIWDNASDKQLIEWALDEIKRALAAD